MVILLGVCFGSFATMASYRLPRELSILTRSSFCLHCQAKLSLRDLVPVISWLTAGGKCRHCKTKISWRYPLVEIACAAMFAAIFFTFGLTLQALILMLFSCALLVMVVADLETQLIPDEIHLFLIPLGISYHFVMNGSASDIMLSTLIAGSIGLFLHYGYYWLRGFHGLGFGDVKFLFVAGLWLGTVAPLPAFVFYSGVIGVVFGVAWRVLFKQERFPFGPALAISLCLLVIWPQTSNVFWSFIESAIGAI